MPYTVTTKQPRHLDLGKGDLTWVSRRVVATLDEACEGFTLADEAREQFAERGGTVAFHDGTLIKIEAMSPMTDLEDERNAAREELVATNKRITLLRGELALEESRREQQERLYKRACFDVDAYNAAQEQK